MVIKKKILAVDDEKALCNILSLNLEDAGFEVTKAYSGNEAIRLFEQDKVDAIISDIRMPDGDGIQLLTEIKNRDPSFPVVLFMTAFADMTVPEAYSLGAEGFFKKPVKYDQLIAKIEECLRPKPDCWLNRNARLEVDVSVELSFDSFHTVVKAHGLNIGRGGLFLKTEGPSAQIQPNQCVDFRIAFTDGKYSPLNGKGICRWRRDDDSPDRPRGVGIEFLELDAATCRSLSALALDLKMISYIPIA